MDQNKRGQEIYNIDDVIGKKGHSSEISSSEASWSNLVWSDANVLTQQPDTLSPEQVKKIFIPVIQAVENNDPGEKMRDRVLRWVADLAEEAMKGPRLDASVIDISVRYLYFFCEDIFQAVYDVFTQPDTGLHPAFKEAAERYKSS